MPEDMYPLRADNSLGMQAGAKERAFFDCLSGSLNQIAEAAQPQDWWLERRPQQLVHRKGNSSYMRTTPKEGSSQRTSTLESPSRKPPIIKVAPAICSPHQRGQQNASQYDISSFRERISHLRQKVQNEKKNKWTCIWKYKWNHLQVK